MASSIKSNSIYSCPDGNCGFQTTNVDRYIDHRLRSKLYGVDKQIDEAIKGVKNYVQSDECIDGICGKVSKKLLEKAEELKKKEQTKTEEESLL